MADYLFVPQTVLDRWSEQGKVQVEGTVLTLLKENKAFALTPAVRFLRMEAGEDAVGLLQKVKTASALKQMGAEHYMDSVLLGDNAYEVQQGFLADAAAVRKAVGAGGPDSPSSQGIAQTSAQGLGISPTSHPGAPKLDAKAAPKPGDAKKGSGEPEALGQFFLDNLK